MPKAATQSSTKAATKAANAKTAKTPKEEKVKRPPSAYNIFVKEKLAVLKAENPEMSNKEAFIAAAGLWKDAPENPKRGQPTVSRPKKKKTEEDKENAASKPKSKSKSKAKPKKVEEVEAQSEEEPLDMDSDE